MYLEQRVEQLEKQVQELLKLVDKKENKTQFSQTIGIDWVKAWNRLQKSNNELRKEIIQEAKDFVKEMKKFITNTDGYDQKHPKYGLIKYKVYKFAYDKVDFKIDAKTKTIVVEIGNRNQGRFAATAKCMDSDVFNVHIGKAIALGRVLGLDVSRFENAVVPDEVVVGQLLEGEDKSVFEGKSPLYEVISTKAYEANMLVKSSGVGHSHLEGKEAFGGNFKTNDWWQIIDDSNAKY